MKKRLIISTLCGLFCAGFCMVGDQAVGLSNIGGPQLPWPVVGQIICSRTLIGFGIGISCLNLGKWFIHGPVMGIIFSSPLAFSCLMTPQYAVKLFGLTFLFGAIYGLFTEVITTVVFKAYQVPRKS